MIGERESELQGLRPAPRRCPVPHAATVCAWIEEELQNLRGVLDGDGGSDALRGLFADEQLVVALEGQITGVAVLDLGDGATNPQRSIGC